MFIFVKKPEDYIVYAVISVVSTSGGNIVNIVYRRKYCRTRFTVHMKLRRHIPPIIKLFAMLLSQQVFCNSDTTMLGLMHGNYEVGLYSTAVKIYNIINSLMASITWVVMPKLSYAFAVKDYESINETLKYALGFIATLGFPCVVGMNLFASEIIQIIAGPEYIGAVTGLKILSVTLAISLVWGFVMNIILLPSGSDGVCLKACAISAVFNLIANAIFIPQFKLEAAATTTALSQLIGLIVCLPYVDKKIHLGKIRDIVLAPCVGSGVMAVVILIISHSMNNLWVKTVMVVVGSCMIYLPIQLVMKNNIVISAMNSLIYHSNKKH